MSWRRRTSQLLSSGLQSVCLALQERHRLHPANTSLHSCMLSRRWPSSDAPVTLPVETCTDVLQTWNQPHKKKSEPVLATEMDWGRPTLPCDDPSASKAKRTKRAAAAIVNVDPRAKSLRGACSMAANEVMHSMVSRPGVSGLLLVAGSHLLGEQTRRERLERRDVLQAPWLARRDQPPPTTDDPALWYDYNVAVNAAQATALALATSGQAGNPLWFTERGKRITASVAHSILRLRVTTNPARLVQSIITRTNVNTEAMQYGRYHEAVALDTYRIFRMDRGDSPRICSSGLVVNPDEPWLGASPDALLPEEGGIVEIKCPFSCRNRSFADVAGEKGEFCLEKFEGSWRLHLSHHYNAQLQVQLFVTQAKFCHFVVLSPTETHVQQIEPDNAFISFAIDKLRKFYFDNVLPALLR